MCTNICFTQFIPKFTLCRVYSLGCETLTNVIYLELYNGSTDNVVDSLTVTLKSAM